MPHLLRGSLDWEVVSLWRFISIVFIDVGGPSSMWVDLVPGQVILGQIGKMAKLEPASQWAAFLHSLCFRFLPWALALTSLSSVFLFGSVNQKLFPALRCFWSWHLLQQESRNWNIPERRPYLSLAGIVLFLAFCFEIVLRVQPRLAWNLPCRSGLPLISCSLPQPPKCWDYMWAPPSLVSSSV